MQSRVLHNQRSAISITNSNWLSQMVNEIDSLIWLLNEFYTDGYYVFVYD